MDYIADDQNFIGMLKGSNSQLQTPSITVDELVNLQFYTEMVTVPDEVFQALAEIRRKLRDEGIRPSDRRFKQSLSLLRAKALLEQRHEVRLEDVMLLCHSLWETPEQRDTVGEIINELAQDKVTAKVEETEKELQEILKWVNEEQNTEAILEANQKLKGLEGELAKMAKEHPNRKEIPALIEKLQKTRKDIAENILAL